jgi:hypothetical protein
MAGSETSHEQSFAISEFCALLTTITWFVDSLDYVIASLVVKDVIKQKNTHDLLP